MHTLFCIMSCVLLFGYSEGLQCYECIGVSATVDGVEHAGILSDVGGVVTALLGKTLQPTCLSTNEGDLGDFLGAETCSEGDYCAYYNLTLTNDNYSGQNLVVDAAIRLCQVGIYY